MQNEGITYFVAESMWFHSLGKKYTNLSTIENAIEIYNKIPNYKRKLGNGIGIVIDGIDYSLYENGKVEKLENYPELRENVKILESISILQKEYEREKLDRMSYRYPETDVYKNTFGITDMEELRFAENFWVELKLVTLDDFEMKKECYESYLNLHKYLYEGFYDWAGQERIEELYRTDGIVYKNLEDIRKNGEDIISSISRLAYKPPNIIAARVYSKGIKDLWLNHSFAKGNLITAVAFIKIVAKKRGQPLDLKAFRVNNNLRTSVKEAAKGKQRNLETILERALDRDYIPGGY